MIKNMVESNYKLQSLQVPTFQQVLGTNPICMAAPGKDGDNFVLDMATSSVALGKVTKYFS